MQIDQPAFPSVPQATYLYIALKHSSNNLIQTNPIQTTTGRPPRRDLPISSDRVKLPNSRLSINAGNPMGCQLCATYTRRPLDLLRCQADWYWRCMDVGFHAPSAAKGMALIACLDCHLPMMKGEDGWPGGSDVRADLVAGKGLSRLAAFGRIHSRFYVVMTLQSGNL